MRPDSNALETLPEAKRVLIFGGSGHIGGPASHYINRNAPGVAIRLATSSADKVSAMTAQHPAAEVVVANYFDPASLDNALAGVDRILMLVPDWADDRTATTNLVEAVHKAGTVTNLVRVVGDPPGIHAESDVSTLLREWGGGTAVQHQHARAILGASHLPVTFLNIASYFMDDFLTMFAPPLVTQRMLTLPFDHRMAFIDAFDVGEAAGAVLLSTDQRHVGKTYNLDNGHDVMPFSEVAALLSDVLGETIKYDDSPEKFVELNGDIIRAWVGREDAAEYYVEYFRWERDQPTMWRKTDILEYLLGRPGKALRTWFEENKQSLAAPVG